MVCKTDKTQVANSSIGKHMAIWTNTLAKNVSVFKPSSLLLLTSGGPLYCSTSAQGGYYAHYLQVKIL